MTATAARDVTISQTSLISAILMNLDKQGVGGVRQEHFDAIVRAADIIIESLAVKYDAEDAS